MSEKQNSTSLQLIGCLLCDDVRAEANGKQIFIGVYATDIGVREFPTSFNLTCVAHLRNSMPSRHEIEIRMFIGKKVASKGRIAFEATRIGAAHIPIKLPSIALTSPDKIRVQLRVGNSWKNAIDLDVQTFDALEMPM